MTMRTRINANRCCSQVHRWLGFVVHLIQDRLESIAASFAAMFSSRLAPLPAISIRIERLIVRLPTAVPRYFWVFSLPHCVFSPIRMGFDLVFQCHKASRTFGGSPMISLSNTTNHRSKIGCQ
ncbi:hypothetical protein I3760_16G113300 [Carya illinoinensis]|nr:hypothetical protein I3760_16G113300 [Carya illinoinensis]KAG2665078.1 hypothetical protein I3760_16G113300 [Carya illinoinensis]KAG2665079.1 hypothetical protein I3760_16G113300 [Carya illinoinensis]